MSMEAAGHRLFQPDDTAYGKLLSALKARTGRGVLLNTSFNIHGDPLVCSPQDALDTLKRTRNDYLVIGNYLVRGVQ